jgi:nucleotide-binding universal stress UspA family protein
MPFGLPIAVAGAEREVSDHAMFQNILYPYDGTVRGMNATPRVLQLVRRMAAQLRVLHVHSGSESRLQSFEDLETRISSDLRDDEHLPAPIFDVVEGQAHEQILRYARKHNIDLIAMQAGGSRPLQRLFRRSTTESILRNAPCPVWAVAGSRQSRADVERIVCAVGHSNDSRGILRSAAELARTLHAELTLAYAVPELNEGTLARMSQDPPFLSRAAARRHLHSLALGEDVHADYAAEIGPDGDVFAQIARKTKADLLLLNRSVLAMIPSIYRLLQRSGCSVLITNTGADGIRRNKKVSDSEISVAISTSAVTRKPTPTR